MSEINFLRATPNAMPKVRGLFQLADELDASQDVYLSKISGFKAPVRKASKTFAEAFGSGASEVVLAVEGITVIGFVALATLVEENMKSTYISGIYVSPDHRGKGLGKQLIDKAVEKAKKDRSVALKLQVIATNEPAIALYEKLGFKQVSIFYVKEISNVKISSSVTKW